MKALASCLGILLTIALSFSTKLNTETPPHPMSVADQVCSLPMNLEATTFKAERLLTSIAKSTEAQAQEKKSTESVKKEKKLITLTADADPFEQAPLLAQAPSTRQSSCSSGRCGTSGCSSGQCGQRQQTQTALTILPNGAPIRNVQSGCSSGGCNSGSASGCNSGGCSGGGRRLLRLRR